MTEYTEALAIANRLLDEPHANPDDDTRVVSRQLLRTAGRMAAVKTKLREIVTLCPETSAESWQRVNILLQALEDTE